MTRKVPERFHFSLPTDGSESTFVAQLVDLLQTYGYAINQLLDLRVENGFTDRDDSTIAFDDGTRTLTITPVGASFVYFQGGNRYEITEADTVVIADTEGLHFIYYDDTGLVVTTTFSDDIIVEYAFVAAIYWDATNNEAVYVGDERHSNVMDSRTHLYNHNTFSARYGDGLGLGNMDTGQSGASDSHAQLSVADGSIWDEDIEVTIADDAPQDLSTIAEIPLFYRSGASGDWRKIAATNFPVTTTGSGRGAWNEDTGATWQLTEITNQDYALTHLYATPDIDNPIIGIIGQNEYATANLAEAGAEVELLALELGQLAVLTPEFVPIATIIFQTSNSKGNTVKSSIEPTAAGADFIDWRPIIL